MTPEQRKRVEEAKAKADKERLTRQRMDKRAKQHGESPAAGVPAPRDPVPVDVYFEPSREKFWTKNGTGEWMPINKTALDMILRSNWYSQYEKLTNSLTKVEEKMLSVMMHHSVKYAGELAGWTPGVHTICGNRVLISRGAAIPEPKRGNWAYIKKFIAELLGDEGKYFYSWMRAAYKSLRGGSPFAPGQLLAIAGPVGCGKSLLQKLITIMLGGRMAKPYQYLMGLTPFNGDLISSEHLVLDDEVGKSDIKSRRHFGAMIKSTVANQQISAHPKGGKPFTTEPFWRISLSLNDEPESLMILPPLDSDIEDKVLLLRASKASVPYPSKALPTMQSYWEQLVSEVPAYLFALLKWEIPEPLRDIRFGVKAYQNRDLLISLSSLSPESKLWSLILQSGIIGANTKLWTGTQIDLERELQASSVAKQFEQLCTWATACGTYLSRLAKTMPKNVEREVGPGNKNIYHLAIE